MRTLGQLLAKFGIFYREAREFCDFASVPVHLSLEQDGPQRQSCAVLVRSKINSCLVKFEDGFTAVTSHNALRRRKIGGDYGD